MSSGRAESLQRRRRQQRSNPSSSFTSLRPSSQFFAIIILALALFVSPGRGAVHTATAKAFSSLSQKWRLSTGRDTQANLSNRPPLAPVVIVPGTGGNQLEARLTADFEAAKPWCYSFNKDYFRLWLDVKTLFPPFTSCFVDRLSLDYDLETDSYSNAKGVETRVPYFGTTQGMDYLDPSLKIVTAYMIHLVNALKARGYETGKSLYGAPYDFRFAPGPHASDVALKYMKDLKELIEAASKTNEDEPVVLLAHSMGGLWTLYFLNQQTPEWKEQYVSRFVAVSTPWGGAVEQMMTFASGNPEGVPFVNPLIVREQQRRSESNLWLLPVSRVFGDRPLVATSARNYTAAEMRQFLVDIGFPEGVATYNSRIPHLTDILQPPKVPVTLVYGHQVPTADAFSYVKRGFEDRPEVIDGDGDGTVNLCSLTALVKEWEGVEEQQLKVIPLANKGHMSILHDADSVGVIVDVLMEASLQEQPPVYSSS